MTSSVPGGFWPYTDPDKNINKIDEPKDVETARNSATERADLSISMQEQYPVPEPLTFDDSAYQPPQNYTPSKNFQFSTHTLLPLLYGKNLVIQLPHSNRILNQIETKNHGNERFFNSTSLFNASYFYQIYSSQIHRLRC